MTSKIECTCRNVITGILVVAVGGSYTASYLLSITAQRTAETVGRVCTEVLTNATATVCQTAEASLHKQNIAYGFVTVALPFLTGFLAIHLKNPRDGHYNDEGIDFTPRTA